MRNEIVVGLDDSPSGKAALQWAAQQAKITGAALRAVHGLGGPYGLGSAGIPPPIHPMEVTPGHLVGDGGEEQPEQASAVAAPETEPAHKSGVGASQRAVVVAGIDGSSEALAAARYAAAAAEMRGCALLLVHAFPDHHLDGPRNGGRLVGLAHKSPRSCWPACRAAGGTPRAFMCTPWPSPAIQRRC